MVPTITSKLYDGSLVKISRRKAMVGEKVGLMSKITILLKNQGAYLDDIPKNDYIALGDALNPSRLRILEKDAKSAQLIRVL